MTVRKVELCQNGSTAATCVGAVTVVSGSKEFDIASVGVGSEVGNFGEIGVLPVGATFTHIRLTINPVFTLTTPPQGVTGDSGASSDAGTCFTKSANDNTNAATLGGGSTAAGSQPQQMVVPFPSDDGGTAGTPTTAQFNAIDVHRPSATPNEMFFIAKLAAPFEVADKKPLISVQFDTVGAVAFQNGGGGNCQNVYPLPPTATISLTMP